MAARDGQVRPVRRVAGQQRQLALFRDRYWGTPLPIWRCPEGHVVCAASRAHLSELAGQDLSHIDPHRPVIDGVTFACPHCGQNARRVEAVIDAWFDSGSMPAAQFGYPYRPGSVDDLRLPADFICEAVDQTRGWFYSLLAVNTLVFDCAPYRTVMSLGHVVDGDGKKMSKSVGNIIDPWAILGTRGANPMRWWMFHQGSPWTATRTSLEAMQGVHVRDARGPCGTPGAFSPPTPSSTISTRPMAKFPGRPTGNCLTAGCARVFRRQWPR